MTRLLVSVRNAEEAAIAADAGVDLIDVKEPSRGSLGAADRHTLEQVLARVAGRRPVSAALGELADPEAVIRCRDLPPCQYAKLGLSHMAGRSDWRQRWQVALSALPPSVAPVAVAYADSRAAQSPPLDDVLAAAQELGCVALLIDTWDKASGTLVDHLSARDLAAVAEQTRAAGLLFALAGSLRIEHLPLVLAAQPDYVAVRGAACRGGRTGTIDERAIQALLRQLAPPEIIGPIPPLDQTVGHNSAGLGS